MNLHVVLQLLVLSGYELVLAWDIAATGSCKLTKYSSSAWVLQPLNHCRACRPGQIVTQHQHSKASQLLQLLISDRIKKRFDVGRDPVAVQIFSEAKNARCFAMAPRLVLEAVLDLIVWMWGRNW